MDTKADPTESTPLEGDPVGGSGPVEGVRGRWSAIPSTGRVLIVVLILVGLGIVGELVGGRVWGWYTRRLSAVDPLDEVLQDLRL